MPWNDRTKRRLKLRELDIFLAVVETGAMGKAADRLHMTQPAVSKAIADLEHTFGVRLVDRSRQGAEPTLFGRTLLKRGVAIFDELKQSVKDIDFLADPTSGELHIGCTETITAGLVSAAIDRLDQEHSNLAFHLVLADAATLHFQFLRERKCELVIARMLAPTPEPDMDAELLFYERHFIATKPPNKWLKRRKIALAEISDGPWIFSLLEGEPGTPLFEAFRANGLDFPRAKVLSNSLNLRNSLLSTGRYLTLVPGSVLRFVPDHLLLKVLPIELPRAQLPIAIVTLKNRTLSPAAQLFIDCVRTLAKPLA